MPLRTRPGARASATRPGGRRGDSARSRPPRSPAGTGPGRQSAPRSVGASRADATSPARWPARKAAARRLRGRLVRAWAISAAWARGPNVARINLCPQSSTDTGLLRGTNRRRRRHRRSRSPAIVRVRRSQPTHSSGTLPLDGDRLGFVADRAALLDHVEPHPEVVHDHILRQLAERSSGAPQPARRRSRSSCGPATPCASATTRRPSRTPRSHPRRASRRPLHLRQGPRTSGPGQRASRARGGCRRR